jgi:hypothetical protein
MNRYLTELKLNKQSPPDLRTSVRIQLLWLCTVTFQKLTKQEILTESVTTDAFAKFYHLLKGVPKAEETDSKRYAAIKKILTKCTEKQLTFARVGKTCPKRVSYGA